MTAEWYQRISSITGYTFLKNDSGEVVVIDEDLCLTATSQETLAFIGIVDPRIRRELDEESA